MRDDFMRSSEKTEQGRRRFCERWPDWRNRRAGRSRSSAKTPQAACRDIGYMAHPSLLYDEMSGMENLRYFGRLYGILGDGAAKK